jgi:hypothetical protein
MGSSTTPGWTPARQENSRERAADRKSNAGDTSGENKIANTLALADQNWRKKNPAAKLTVEQEKRI